jgi:hypothetical protein
MPPKGIRNRMKKRSKVIAACITLLMPTSFLVASSASALGVNDVSEAMRYGSDGRVIGEVVESLEDQDDDATLIEAPWPMNFFGRTYTGICITSNGTVSPVVFEDNPDCDDNYDDTMAGLAESAAAPLIAALSSDNDLGETTTEWDAQVSTFRNESGTIRVTTSTNHGLATNDVTSVFVTHPSFANGNDVDGREDEFWFEDVTVTRVSNTVFTFSGSAATNYEGDTYTPVLPAINTNVSVTAGYVFSSSALDQNGVDDGVGKINTLYVGETTVDGRDAWVYTNYRTVTNDQVNPDVFTNTFQIVLVKRATLNGATRGFDFDIEYNYGSIMDGDDGYDADGGSCSYMNSECRTGVGLVDWDPISEAADVYELFPNTPSRDLNDWYASGMTNNRLNSEINGRYTFAMVGGAVQGFATPVMDGTGTTVARPVAPSPLDAVPEQAGAFGNYTMLEDGVEIDVSLVRNEAGNGLVLSSGDFVVELSGFAADGTALELDAAGNLILNRDGLAGVSGIGFAPESTVRVYAFSTPISMGNVFTDTDGNFNTQLPIPSSLEAGIHNIQLAGYDADLKVKVLTIGVSIRDLDAPVAAPAATPTLAATGFDLSMLMALGFALVAFGLINRVNRRRNVVTPAQK